MSWVGIVDFEFVRSFCEDEVIGGAAIAGLNLFLKRYLNDQTNAPTVSDWVKENERKNIYTRAIKHDEGNKTRKKEVLFFYPPNEHGMGQHFEDELDPDVKEKINLRMIPFSPFIGADDFLRILNMKEDGDVYDLVVVWGLEAFKPYHSQFWQSAPQQNESQYNKQEYGFRDYLENKNGEEYIVSQLRDISSNALSHVLIVLNDENSLDANQGKKQKRFEFNHKLFNYSICARELVANDLKVCNMPRITGNFYGHTTIITIKDNVIDRRIVKYPSEIVLYDSTNKYNTHSKSNKRVKEKDTKIKPTTKEETNDKRPKHREAYFMNDIMASISVSSRTENVILENTVENDPFLMEDHSLHFEWQSVGFCHIDAQRIERSIAYLSERKEVKDFIEIVDKMSLREMLDNYGQLTDMLSLKISLKDLADYTGMTYSKGGKDSTGGKRWEALRNSIQKINDILIRFKIAEAGFSYEKDSFVRLIETAKIIDSGRNIIEFKIQPVAFLHLTKFCLSTSIKAFNYRNQFIPKSMIKELWAARAHKFICNKVFRANKYNNGIIRFNFNKFAAAVFNLEDDSAESVKSAVGKSVYFKRKEVMERTYKALSRISQENTDCPYKKLSIAKEGKETIITAECHTQKDS